MAKCAKLRSWQHPLGQDIWVFEKLLMETICANKELHHETWKKAKLALIKAVFRACWGYLEPEQHAWEVWFCLRFVENGIRQ